MTAVVLGAAALIVYLAMRWVIDPIRSCPDGHSILQLAGSAERSRLTGCIVAASDFEESLKRDYALISGYIVLFGFASTLLLLASRARQPVPWSVRLGRRIWLVGMIAGLLDVAENILIARSLVFRDGVVMLSGDGVALAVLTVAWLKWLLLATAIVVLVVGTWTVCAPRARDGVPAGECAPYEVSEEWSVCCSGGGIRAASFALGVLTQLDLGDRLSQMRYLAAVSGGNYAATGWVLQRARMADPLKGAAACRVRDNLTRGLDAASVPATTSIGEDEQQGLIPERNRRADGRHRYLRNGSGRLGRAVIYAALAVLFNIAIVIGIVTIVAWPLGWLLGSFAVQPCLGSPSPSCQAGVSSLEGGPRTWVPMVALITIGLGGLLVSTAFPGGLGRLVARFSIGIAAAGAVLGVLLRGLPELIIRLQQLTTWQPATQPEVAAKIGTATAAGSTLGGISIAAVLTFATKLAAPTASRWIIRAVPRLGGVLLAMTLALYALWVSGSVASHSGYWAHTIDLKWWPISLNGPSVAIGITVIIAAIWLFVDTQQISLRELYRSRLQHTFAAESDGEGLPTVKQLTWNSSELGSQSFRPELIVCCAAGRIGLSPNGLPSESFTISPDRVTYGHNIAVDTDRYLKQLDGLALSRLNFVSSWMATSGAAFSSTMGRARLGTTFALLAAFNIDLGVWLPHPKKVASGNQDFPRVRLNYLMKEIFGRYDREDDYCFVTDGGHWDNLGLVELIRRKCRHIVCIDASGDPIGSLATLHQATDLAITSIPGIVTFNLIGLTDISGIDGHLPSRSVTTLTYEVKPNEDEQCGWSGTIIYAKAQVSGDLPQHVLRFARADPRFPCYSTANQLLDDQQCQYLLALGDKVGRDVIKIMKKIELKANGQQETQSAGPASSGSEPVEGVVRDLPTVAQDAIVGSSD